MSNLLLPRRFYNQLQGASQVNANGLGSRVIYSCDVANTLDLVSGALGVPVGNPPVVATPYGTGRSFLTASSQGVELSTRNIADSMPVTVSVIARVDNFDGIIYSLNGTNYNAILAVGFNLVNAWQVNTASSGGSNLQVGGATTGWHHFVTIHRSGTFDMYIDGVKGTKSGGGNWAQPTAGNHSIGYRKGGVSLRYFTGQIQDLTVFSGELTEEEIFRVFANPHQFEKVSE